ncbi:MAG TPA: OmpA family protein [Ignavibacteria bacterium]|nr:OmpA family protein [Ignavibacteria bacterium]HMR41981.1 OmpA family protein [Ignavibacteria bacterium]
MAENFIEELNSYITPDIISKLSNVIGEKSTITKTALAMGLPAVLGSLIQKSSTEQGASEIIKIIKNEGYNGSQLNNLAGVFDSKDSFSRLINAASPVLDSIFGDKLHHVTNSLSKESGVGSNATSYILGFLASLLMSFIGKKVNSDGLNADGLKNMLAGQKHFLKKMIPAGLAGMLGLSGFENVTSAPRDIKANVKEESTGFKKFLPWLLLGLAALLLLLWWRSCKQEPAPVTIKKDTVKSKAETNIVLPPKTGDMMMDSIYASLGKFVIKKLPGGTEIIIAESGVEPKLIAFIEDKTKPADKETWFSFDRILFETDKADLRPSSGLQLANIAAIMKAYPEIEIKIGGYTDNTGNKQHNLKLSQERANSVVKYLETLGIPDSRMKAEGYGDQFPVASNDTPEGRSKNRRIDIRVSKK